MRRTSRNKKKNFILNAELFSASNWIFYFYFLLCCNTFDAAKKSCSFTERKIANTLVDELYSKHCRRRRQQQKRKNVCASRAKASAWHWLGSKSRVERKNAIAIAALAPAMVPNESWLAPSSTVLILTTSSVGARHVMRNMCRSSFLLCCALT